MLLVYLQRYFKYYVTFTKSMTDKKLNFIAKWLLVSAAICLYGNEVQNNVLQHKNNELSYILKLKQEIELIENDDDLYRRTYRARCFNYAAIYYGKEGEKGTVLIPRSYNWRNSVDFEEILKIDARNYFFCSAIIKDDKRLDNIKQYSLNQ